MTVNKEKRSWSKKECRDRYVTGKEIGIRELAKIANRHPATVGRWSSDGDWVKDRERHAIRMRTTTENKIIEKTSDRISDNIAKLNEEHVQGSDVFRKLSQQFAGILVNQVLNSNADKRPEMITDKEFSMALQRYVGIYSTAINLQRQALNMDYLNLDAAIAKTMGAGLEVSNPSLEFMISQLQEAGFTVNPPQKLVNQD